MMVTFDCPDRACDEGEVMFEIEAGLEGDASVPYGTRTVYEGGLLARTCLPDHGWSDEDDIDGWDAAVAAYRED